MLDHYYFMIEELRNTRKEMRKVFNQQLNNKANKRNEVMRRTVHTISIRMDMTVDRRIADLKSRIASEEMMMRAQK